MTVALKNLTKKYWTGLKKDAGISSSKWYKKADAAVGPAIAKFEKARANWKKEKSYDTYLGYFNALDALNAAFDKFVTKKDVTSTETKKDVAAEILDWKTEITKKKAAIAKKYPPEKMKKLNATAMGDRADKLYAGLNLD